MAERGIRAAAAGAGSSAATGASADRPTDVAVADGPTASDRVLIDFLAERYRGMRPIAWGRQLHELWLTAGLYSGVLGIGSLVEADEASGAKRYAATVCAPPPVAAAPLTREMDGDHATS